MSDETKTDAEGDTTSFGYRQVGRAEKAGLVRGVFDSVASSYDRMNDLMSLGVHRIWKDLTVVRANPQPGEVLVDVAGGTGDLARAWMRRGLRVRRRRGGAAPSAIVVDVNAEMILAGRARGADRKTREDDCLSWAVGDAEKLPLPDGHADCVSIAFGIRNVTDRATALSEMRRVLKPGGRFLCLEFSRPTSDLVQQAYDVWSFEAIPRIGAAVAGDRESYEYLVESIRRFPSQEAFAEEVRAAGFSRVSVTNFTGGVAALHMGWA